METIVSRHGQTIRVTPVPADPIAALYGRGKGEGLTRKLLQERAKDKEKRNTSEYEKSKQ